LAIAGITTEPTRPRTSLSKDCFHCGLPVPAGLNLVVKLDGENKPVCCHGCAAVATTIIDSGNANYYKTRTSLAKRPEKLLAALSVDSELYELPDIQKDFVKPISGDYLQADLILQGVTCAACLWLNEKTLNNIPGVVQAEVNYSTHRVRVRWKPKQTTLSIILSTVKSIGYIAHPYDRETQQSISDQEGKSQLRRLLVAGLFGMQVMMISISLYFGDWMGMDDTIRSLFRWLVLVLTIPVMIWSGVPFFRSAWNGLRRFNAEMDLPVSLAIILAFCSSLYATLNQQGDVYFDSIVMFIFFLTGSRYFEWLARKKNLDAIENLANAVPATANLIIDLDETKLVSARQLQVGDRVVVKVGEAVPSDGEITSGQSSFGESLLTGESRPQDRQNGQAVIGGSINLSQPVQVLITKPVVHSVITEIQNLVQSLQSEKAPIAELADRIAGRFVTVIIIMTVCVAAYWVWQGNPNWLSIALATLIVTCPCALSLATPASLSAVTRRLQKLGLLIKGKGVIEKAQTITDVVFDKTGTLTMGKPALVKTHCIPQYSENDCLMIACALEKWSEHPIAQAFNAFNLKQVLPIAEAVRVEVGQGISGRVKGCIYTIGNRRFIESKLGLNTVQNFHKNLVHDELMSVYLSSESEVLAGFTFSDPVRNEAKSVVEALKQRGLKVHLMTGDKPEIAVPLAKSLNIHHVSCDMMPVDKMQAVRYLKRRKAIVMMIGDGINDAPVIAEADCSIAMGSASTLAKHCADIVLVKNSLEPVVELLNYAKKTVLVIRQNLTWAALYNLSAIPVAACGYIEPWMAAIGMSLSSFLVVGNAIRLRH
jgi:P-type Cu2+ transporter